MSIPILTELNDDLKRLAIAGSDLAIGDISLKKKLPVLAKMGEKSPVFTRIANLTETLITKNENTPDHLMNLSQLVHSVLYTTGKTGFEGEMMMESRIGDYPTELPFSLLRPLIEALTTKGAGRAERIEHAFQSGEIYDLRLVVPLLSALDDSYQEIADLVANDILPQYGKGLLPMLQSTFSVKGKKGDGRRLKVMSKILKDKGLPFYLECADKGSEQVRIASLEILASYEEAEDVILEYTMAKKLETRKAAYQALVKRESEKAINCLMNALEGKDRNIVIEVAAGSGSAKLVESLLSFAKGVYVDFLATKQQEKADVLFSLMDCFYQVPNENVTAFLREIIECRDLSPTFARTAVRNLFIKGKETFEYVESIHRMPRRSGLADLSFEASLYIRSKEEIYNLYSRYVNRTRKDPAGQAILEFMEQVIFFSAELREYDDKYQRLQYRYYGEEYTAVERFIELEWDERWVELLMAIDEEHLVYRLPRRITSNQHVEYLLRKLAINPYFSSKRGMGVMTSLIQIGYPQVFEVLVDTLKKTDVNMKSVKFHTRDIVHNLGLFSFLSKNFADELQRIAENEIEHPNLKMRLQDIVFELRKKETTR